MRKSDPLKSGRLPPPPKHMPALTARALQMYGYMDRARSVDRRHWYRHRLLSMLDSMTPEQVSAYYHALIRMRTGALSQKRKKP